MRMLDLISADSIIIHTVHILDSLISLVWNWKSNIYIEWREIEIV